MPRNYSIKDTIEIIRSKYESQEKKSKKPKESVPVSEGKTEEVKIKKDEKDYIVKFDNPVTDEEKEKTNFVSKIARKLKWW